MSAGSCCVLDPHLNAEHHLSLALHFFISHALLLLSRLSSTVFYTPGSNLFVTGVLPLALTVIVLPPSPSPQTKVLPAQVRKSFSLEFVFDDRV